jgi:hypothetical protein
VSGRASRTCGITSMARWNAFCSTSRLITRSVDCLAAGGPRSIAMPFRDRDGLGGKRGDARALSALLAEQHIRLSSSVQTSGDSWRRSETVGNISLCRIGDRRGWRFVQRRKMDDQGQ